MGATAFSLVCSSYFGWGDHSKPLGSYYALLSQRCIPCPTHVVLLSAPAPLLVERLNPDNGRHPVWRQPLLLHSIYFYLDKLVEAVYEPLGLAFRDTSGYCSPAAVRAFVDQALRSFDAGLAEEVLARLLSWRPPRIPAPQSSALIQLSKALSLVDGTNTIRIPSPHAAVPTAASFAANPGPWRHSVRRLWKNAPRMVDCQLPSEIPTHLVDQFAYALFRGETTPRAPDDCFSAFSGFSEACAADIKTLLPDKDQLDGPWIKAQCCDATTSMILREWRLHLLAHGITFPSGAFDIGAAETWLSLYERLVRSHLYLTSVPELHVSAPGRLPDLAQRHNMQRRLIQLHIRQAAHLLQTGDPTLGDLVLESLWCSFIDVIPALCAHRLRAQEAFASRLAPWGTNWGLPTDAMGLLFSDTCAGASQLLGHPMGYDTLCESARLLRGQKLTFADYTNLVLTCFTNRHTSGWQAVAEHIKALSDR